MTPPATDPRIDRLYQRLPAVYRVRDAGQNYPLRALLRVIAEQVNVVEDDVRQLYQDWFIETAEDWVVPYLADLIGYRPVSDAGQAGGLASAEGRALNRVLTPRREVANTISYRRRKGTLVLLERLANDVAGWPAFAVEFFKLLGWNQNINHLHLNRARTADLRCLDALDWLDGPFDRLAHTVEVRRIRSHRTLGQHNIPSVGVFVWRLQSYAVTQTRAHCAEKVQPNCYTFSVLGHDAPLFNQPNAGPDPIRNAEEWTVPAPIRRLALATHPERFYGQGKSLAIWVDGWAGCDPEQPVPVERIVAADLTDWQYAPPPKHIAVDPVLGRFAFPADPETLPRKGVRVSYHYGFSAPIGGGEYRRAILDPSPRDIAIPDPEDATKTVAEIVTPKWYRVGEGQELRRLGQALEQWREDKPLDAVIEITDSGVYVEPLQVRLNAGQTLQLRAASGARPVIRLLDWQTDLPDALTVTLCRASRFTLDGLLVTGRGMSVHGPKRDKPGDPRDPICGGELRIRHCTLVPGWELECDCTPTRETEASLELFDLRAKVRIEHSILGTIQIHENEVRDEPIPVCVIDSILDATSPEREAIGAPGYAHAHAVLTLQRCTVFGIVDVHAVALAENCLFMNCLNVARRQLGCMRFCYVPYGCRTPRRYHCQPDLAAHAIDQQLRARAAAKGEPAPAPTVLNAAKADERQRVRPQFNRERYGTPHYCQLADACADEIKRGADDESEMGVFHDLFQPQRETNLLARLEEFTPAGMDAGVLHAT